MTADNPIHKALPCPKCGRMPRASLGIRYIDQSAARIAKLEYDVSRKLDAIAIMRNTVERRGDRIAELERERDEARAAVARVDEWTFIYGSALVPSGADTFGEGVRACKDQVRALLARKDEREKEAGRG